MLRTLPADDAPAAAAAAPPARARAAADRDDRRRRRGALPAARPGRRAHPEGHRHRASTKAPPGEQIVSVKRTSANDYDPLGDDKEEHPDAGAARGRPGLRHRVDDRGLPRTTRSTSRPTATPGVGLYVDAEPSVNARSLEIQTPEPGWTMEIYGARSKPPDELAERRLDAARRRRGRASASRASSSTPATATTATTSSGSRRCRRTQDQVAITQVTLSAPR